MGQQVFFIQEGKNNFTANTTQESFWVEYKPLTPYYLAPHNSHQPGLWAKAIRPRPVCTCVGAFCLRQTWGRLWNIFESMCFFQSLIAAIECVLDRRAALPCTSPTTRTKYEPRVTTTTSRDVHVHRARLAALFCRRWSLCGVPSTASFRAVWDVVTVVRCSCRSRVLQGMSLVRSTWSKYVLYVVCKHAYCCANYDIVCL